MALDDIIMRASPEEQTYSLLVDVMSGPTYYEDAPVEMRAAYLAMVLHGRAAADAARAPAPNIEGEAFRRA